MDRINNEKEKLIERYLLEELSDEERRQFDQFMNEIDFQKEVEFQRNLLKTIEQKEDVKLKNRLKKEEQTIQKPLPTLPAKSFPLRRMASIAAAILLLVLVCWKFLIPTEVDLFATNFEPHTNTLVPTSRSSENLNLTEQTFSQYEAGKYKEALPGFKKILSKNNNDNISFYHANALLAVGDTKEAINIFQRILQNNKTDYLAPTKWNLALAYISQNNFSEAIPLLNELLEDPFHKEKAKKLLTQLK